MTDAPPNLFTPLKVGRYTLRNRILMAPLTRNRAEADLVPNKKWAKLYYEQRATAGLIVAEATQFSLDGQGYPKTPGVFTPEQVEGWKDVVAGVHAKGCVFFCQLWHAGRHSHSSFQPDGRVPGAPSPVKMKSENVLTNTGYQPWETPRELTIEEIEVIKEQFRKGVENIIAAGFDGVELHSANGYLIDQFLRDGTNKRTDKYGGSFDNRARFLLELVQIAVDVAGNDRVGVRLSPGGTYIEVLDSNHVGLFTRVLQLLRPFDLAYLSIIESSEQDVRHGGEIIPCSVLRPHYPGVMFANNYYDKAKAEAMIASGDADAIMFGRLFLANPDLVLRFAADSEDFNQQDFGSFFGGTDKGYVDYPFMSEGDANDQNGVKA